MTALLYVLGVLLWLAGLIILGALLAFWVEKKIPSKRIVRVTIGRVPWKVNQWYTFAIWCIVWVFLSALLHERFFD